MRIALSIKAGKLMPSTSLRKLGTKSCIDIDMFLNFSS
ncbi:MAG: transposase [Aphanothece sp. CMT-3BRIN-NPC111]|nr:transposase [Aphanothece sp. CMT-3BRIN-NPC111]